MKASPSRDAADSASDSAAMALRLRDTVGRFVRSVRAASGTATTAQSEVLASLERDGPASVAVLAQARGVTHQSMRLVVARLAGQGLLDLRPDPADGRSQLVSLSAAGRKAVKADQAARCAHLERILDSELTAPERRLLDEAIGLLDRLSRAG